MAPSRHADRVKRFFGIDPDDTLADLTYDNDGSYYETEPTTKDVLLELFPSLPGIARYFKELFPFLGWIFHYNLTWLLGDLIAGQQ